MAAEFEAPYFPIIYVRGYAMRQSDINETSEDPYMGVNLGATKRRKDSYAEVERHIFEGPLVRLMKEHGYTDIYVDGSEAFATIPPRSIVIYRYYEALDSHFSSPSLKQRLIGDLGSVELMEQRALDLATLIHTICKGVCGTDEELERWFRVHLVAHSMGGLICRCLLQKFGDRITNSLNQSMVHKLFTYATPHNGIEVRGLRPRGSTYFARDAMRSYLNLTDDKNQPVTGDVNVLTGTFSVDRVFCLVGTNWRDYPALWGLWRVVAGEGSDGLVRIRNATVQGARSALVYRSHSGPHGIVNSDEGYDILARFLFGHMAVDGRLTVTNVPPSPGLDYSHYTEATVAVAGTSEVNLTERKKDHWSAQFSNAAIKASPGPLFSIFFPRLDEASPEVRFTVDLAVSRSVPLIERRRAPNRHLPNFYLFRKTLLVAIRADRSMAYWSDDESSTASDSGQPVIMRDLPDGLRQAEIELSSANGFAAILTLTITDGHDETGGPRTARESGRLNQNRGGTVAPDEEPVLELATDKAALDDMDDYITSQETETEEEDEPEPKKV